MQFPHAGATSHPADMEGMPDPLDLITVRDLDGAPWLVLASAPKWSQPLPPEMEAREAPQLRAWMDIWAYLVPQAGVAALKRWARGKDWDGRWMPEPPRGEDLLLAAHPVTTWWPGNGQDTVFWSTSRGPQPAEFTLAAVEYPGAGHSVVSPARTEAAGFLPGRRLFDVLGLTRGIDFTWSDDSGIAVQDPSAASGGPAVLAMRTELANRLADAGLALFWTALAGCKAVPSGDYLSRSSDHHPGVSASASYILTGTRIEQVHAIATRYGSEPERERSIKWHPRKFQDVAASRSRRRPDACIPSPAESSFRAVDGLNRSKQDAHGG
jgi:hypothetical protein